MATKQRRKLFTVTIILLFIAGLIISNEQYARQLVVRSLQKSLVHEMEQYKTETAMYIDQRLREVRLLAERRLTREQYLLMMKQIVQRPNSLFMEMGYVAANGELTLSRGQQFNVKDEESFQQAMRGNVVISDPFPALQNRTIKIVVVRVPVEIEGRVVAVLSASTSVDVLFERLKQLAERNHGQITLVNKAGESIYRTGKQMGTEVTVGPNGLLPFTNWRILLYINESYIDKQLQPLLWRNVIATALAFLFLLFVFLWGVRNERKASQSLFFDSLTNLPNRAALELALAKAVQNVKQPFLIVVIDLNQFKVINDVRGYGFGDEVLRQMVKKLKQFFAERSLLYRIGGDEFAVMINDVTVIDELKTLYEWLPLKVQITPENEFLLTASIGVSQFPRHGLTPDELLRAATIATFHAKELHKMSIQYYEPTISEEKMQRITLEQSLRQAIERNEFFMHYQPQMDCRSGQFNGVEALVRWRSPERGIVAPSEFIPVAEETGLIVELGYWIIDEVCRQMNEWHEQGKTLFHVAINLSARQLVELDFVEQVSQRLQRCQFPLTYLTFEITESTAVHHPQRVNEQLQLFKQLGVTIALDDFGTGYSSLSIIQRLNCDILKIDRSFVANMVDDEHVLAIVQAVLSIASHFRLTVVAEGVETEEQWRMLQQLQCHHVQGYYFSKPLAVEQLFEFIA